MAFTFEKFKGVPKIQQPILEKIEENHEDLTDEVKPSALQRIEKLQEVLKVINKHLEILKDEIKS